MARYIDADELLEKLPDHLPYKSSVKRVLTQATEADVVPTSESFPVDVHEALKQRAVEKAKAEVAREIFADIYSVVKKYSMGDIGYSAFVDIIAELKKKYEVQQ